MPDAFIRTGRLSATEREQIERLAERSLTAGQIAQRMQRHAGTINFAMTSMGLRSQVARTFAYTRRGRAVRSFSPDEDALIEALRCQQYTFTKIADVCSKRFDHPRTPATICIRARALATRECVDA
jgi:DNA-binding CsgD family transcriptional regulator